LKKEGEIQVEPLLFSTERSPDKSGKEGVGDDLEKEEGIGVIYKKRRGREDLRNCWEKVPPLGEVEIPAVLRGRWGFSSQ
jgi:hypothetical protein